MKLMFGTYDNFTPPPRINFTSRNKNIRKADDIQRKTRETFPMLSQTYVDGFYNSVKYSSENYARARQISDNMYKKIRIMREIEEYPEYYKLKIPEAERKTLYAIALNGARQLKTGNCKENAKAAVATLCANGYYNSERVELMYRVRFVDKETGSEEYSNIYPLDHSFAVTDMNRGGEKNIVIDPWLGFADSKEGAVARFKQIYDERDYREAISTFRGLFCCQKEITREEFDEKYDIKTSFEFRPTEPYTTRYQLKKLGEYARIMYDGIVIEDKNNKKEN